MLAHLKFCTCHIFYSVHEQEEIKEPLFSCVAVVNLVDPTSSQTSTKSCGDKYKRLDGSLYQASILTLGPGQNSMLSLLLIVSAILLPILASAEYSCDSGITMCCSNTTTTNTTTAEKIIAAYSISESGLSGLIGYGCSAIKTTDNGSVSACINETACCTGQYYSGEIAVNCTATMSV